MYRFKGMQAVFASTCAQANDIAAAAGLEVSHQLSAACRSSSQSGSAAQASASSSGVPADQPALIFLPAAGELAAAVVRELGEKRSVLVAGQAPAGRQQPRPLSPACDAHNAAHSDRQAGCAAGMVRLHAVQTHEAHCMPSASTVAWCC